MNAARESRQFNIHQSLAEFTADRKDFEWGTTDCVQLARHVIRDRTGIDYADRVKELLGYDEPQGLDILSQYGGLSGLITSILEQQPTDDWHEGDPVMIKLLDERLMGIVVRDKVACMAEHGLIQVDTRAIVHGWCVCHKQ